MESMNVAIKDLIPYLKHERWPYFYEKEVILLSDV